LTAAGLRAVWLAGLGVAASAAAWPAPDAALLERGRQLFHGEATLAGRITGHTSDLPPQASRCANCHARGTAPPGGAGRNSPAASSNSASSASAAAAAASSSFGPALDATLLSRDVARRGGPPSRYDEAAFCKLLGTGIDPAYIIIPRTMPRYTLTAADCKALWIYTSQERQ
jgi:hypothetical protein